MSDPVLIVSDGSVTAADRIVEAVSRAGAAVEVQCEPAAALESLRRAPRTVVLDATAPEAESLLGRIRAEGSLAGCAVIALVSALEDEAFAEALAWGADEVVPACALETLTSSVDALRGSDPSARVPGARAAVVVASPSARERTLRARPLRHAGFDVRFAFDRDDLREQWVRDGVAFVVADTETFPGGPAQLRALLQSLPPRPLLAVAPPGDADAYDRTFHGDPCVRVLLRAAPPEDAIFLGNSLAHPELARRAAMPRVLHATVASFREAGRADARYGITYNISGSGLYVRTLTPPAPGSTVWVEARPPFARELVHLECEVAWRRPFGPSAGASAPPGFGARITAASERCARAWAEGYRRLLARRHAQPAAEPASTPA